MRTMSLFPAMFVKFKMSEGQKSFSRYLAQFRYLLTWSVRLQRSNAFRALFLASTNSFFKVPLQVVFRSARFSFSSLWRALLKGWGRVNYSSPWNKMQLLKLWPQSEFRCLSRISSKLKQFSLRAIVGKSLRKLYYVAACPLSEEIHLLVLSHIAVQ